MGNNDKKQRPWLFCVTQMLIGYAYEPLHQPSTNFKSGALDILLLLFSMPFNDLRSTTEGHVCIIPGTPNYQLYMVVSLGWLRTITWKNGVEITMETIHPFQIGFLRVPGKWYFFLKCQRNQPTNQPTNCPAEQGWFWKPDHLKSKSPTSIHTIQIPNKSGWSETWFPLIGGI